VAEVRDPETGERAIVGVGRLSKSHTTDEGEFAVLVADAYQRRGIGTELLRLLVEIGRAEKLRRITGEILRDNAGMVRASRKVGFEIDRRDTGGGTIEAYLDLKAEPAL
jgi:acetyltransferase